ncbi:MAG: exopolyphosphatase [Proteobacteria bacterium]|nr:MAG: exopolyphosphatase [Pseudomonadota bacterium]PIE40099.1 MAG: exopolyphosphatase [Gammaproteobacteria bacterium]
MFDFSKSVDTIKNLFSSRRDHDHYRLITLANLDGVVCAALLKELDMIDRVEFTNPASILGERFHVGHRDITANLPFRRSAHLAFDHYSSERERRSHKILANHINSPGSPTCGRIIYRYFGEKEAFPDFPQDMLEGSDKGSSASFTKEEIISPQGWDLLFVLLNPRTGMQKMKSLQFSHESTLYKLVDYSRRHTIDQILALPEIVERKNLYREHQKSFEQQIKQCAVDYGNIVVLDQRKMDASYVGNRFLIYCIFPECKLSIHINALPESDKVEFAIGKSILDRKAPVNVGNLALQFGGGGHTNAGAFRADADDTDNIVEQLIKTLKNS